MPDLLLELRSEEIPARMQRKAAGDLRKAVTDALVDSGLTYEGAREYWTPRRLVLDIRGLTARSADLREEKKGPRTDAPEKAIAGFLRGAGLDSVDQAEVRSDPKKGDFYVAVIEKPGRAAEEIIAEAMPEIIRNFPWPKSMRWGKASAEPGSLRWVRPLQSIVCTFGPETEEPEVIPFTVGDVTAGNVTYGHRFHAPQAIKVRRFDDYVASLEKAKVVLDAERRKEMIRSDARNLAFAQGLELVEDDALLEEVGNLVEWPVPLMGTFDEAFLDIPPEVIRLTIKENQKCFVLKKSGSEDLTNKFLMVANIEASDGGTEIALGNAKVVNARLSDAKFFWETDLQSVKANGFQPWLDKLSNVTFHAKLGSQGERVRRIAALAEERAPVVGADPALTRRAAEIAKADLNSQMVYEFPELQGLMGRRYATRAGEDESVARAVQEHYSPLGPSDAVPTDPVSVAVALADKLDTLVGFWAIDEKPTGSKDPYALRRAALGVIRLVLENGLPLQISLLCEHALLSKPWFGDDPERANFGMGGSVDSWIEFYDASTGKGFGGGFHEKSGFYSQRAAEIVIDLLSFFHDRLKVYLRDKGARHDLIDAVLSGGAVETGEAGSPSSDPSGHLLPPGEKEETDRSSLTVSSGQPGERAENSRLSPSPRGGEGARRADEGGRPIVGTSSANDDLLAIARRVEALGSFLDTDDGKNLLAGTKRAVNILTAEEKKGTAIAESVNPDHFETDEERSLFDSLEEAENFARQAIEQGAYEKAMEFLSRLRAPVDAFFDNVMVNAEDATVRANRLALMRRIRDATGAVADFSKIQG